MRCLVSREHAMHACLLGLFVWIFRSSPSLFGIVFIYYWNVCCMYILFTVFVRGACPYGMYIFGVEPVWMIGNGYNPVKCDS